MLNHCSLSAEALYTAIVLALVRTLSSMNTTMSGKTRRLAGVSKLVMAIMFRNLHQRTASHNQYDHIDEVFHRCES